MVQLPLVFSFNIEVIAVYYMEIRDPLSAGLFTCKPKGDWQTRDMAVSLGVGDGCHSDPCIPMLFKEENKQLASLFFLII